MAQGREYYGIRLMRLRHRAEETMTFTKQGKGDLSIIPRKLGHRAEKTLAQIGGDYQIKQRRLK